MRFTAVMLAGLAACGPAWAYGRGGFARGGAVAGPHGAAYGGSRGGYAAGPHGAVAGGAHYGAYEGPRGTTVQAGHAGGVAAGPFGGVRAGGAEGVRVTTPGGRSYTDVNRAGVAAGPAGVRVGAGGRTTAAGPYGAAGTGYRVGGNSYAGWAGGGVRVGGVGHATGYWGANTVRTTAVGVRAGHYSYFDRGWYGRHVGAWVAPRWYGGYNLWTVPTWAAVAGFVGVAAAPVVYDYGSTVVIHDDAVTVNGEPAGTASAYADQAASIAAAGQATAPAAADEWQPLGVFGLVQPGDATAQRVFQLAVNKAGVVRGNYYDALADSTQPVAGSVDKKTQRVAWTIGDKKDIVFEAGLDTLTKSEGTALVHYGKERTQQMMLVRLEEPKDGK